MAKVKKLNLEDIPNILEKAMSVINREMEILSGKESLTSEDAKNLIAYCSIASTIYKDYRAEVKAIEIDLRSKSREDIQSIVRADGKPT